MDSPQKITVGDNHFVARTVPVESAIIGGMILVTGGTGFVGRALVRQLVANGQRVRTLIRPSPKTPALPRGVPVEVAVTSLNDERGLRAALRGVEVVYHLAGAEHLGARGDVLGVDGRGTANLARAAAEMRVRRFFYVSHLDADRSSYYPLLKVKGIAEEHIRRSGVPYTIFRSALLYGPEDHFTTSLARLISMFPLFFLPRDGEVLLQPLWVEDLVTCLIWANDMLETINQTYVLGGAEYFPFRRIVEIIMETIGKRRPLLSLPLPALRWLTVTLESMSPSFPFSTFWVDYLSYNRTCPVDSVTRVFGFLPARFTYRLDHLKGLSWAKTLKSRNR
ncbi:MAG: NAD(P)H-binding protein [Anaerolineales bacterium]|nr:NAD(P)H-binding protein [Anaerolineales bacterium]MDW8276611.1 NAD(P)H-binding protein [Anaerolineales bacterium]